VTDSSPRSPLVRLLDWAILLVFGVMLAVILTGGWLLPLGQRRVPVTRPEDVLLVGLGFAAIRLGLRPLSFPRLAPSRILFWGVSVYSALFSFITVNRHFAFRTHALDLGYYDQLLWNITSGNGPLVSLPEMNAWGDHLSPILYLLAPLYALFPTPVLLLVAQSVILSLGAVPTYLLARRWLDDERLAATLALLYLLNPTLHGINLRDFHAAALAIPLLLAAVCFFEASRPVWFGVAVILVLACREDAALPILGLGLWIAAARRRWIPGVGLALASLALLVVLTELVIPNFRGAGYPHLGRYAHLGGSVGEILGTMLLHPARTLAGVVSAPKLVYLLAILAPLGFLPLLGLLELLPALPVFAENLLGTDPVLFHHRTQYNAFLLPFLIAATISGLGRLRGWSVAGGRRLGLVLGFAMIASLALTSRTLNELRVDRVVRTEHQRAAYQVMAAIPPEAAVSTHDPYVPHLTRRSKVFLFPAGLEKSDYALIDLTTYPWKLPGFEVHRQGAEVLLRWRWAGEVKEWQYEVAGERAGYLLLKSRPAQPGRKASRAKTG
jgi:uncharacterized membrane protein